MEWIFLATVLFAAVSAGWWLRGPGKPAESEPWHGRQSLHSDDPNSLPDNDRFATWDDAFNRRIKDKQEFAIEYVDRDGVITNRTIRPLSIHLIRNSPELYIKAFCLLRQEPRTFISSSIRDCINTKTNRKISDLGQHLRRKY